MVEQHRDPLSRVFRALGDPTRRQMIRRLAGGERTVGELAAPFRISLAAASKHVKSLERAGLVQRRVEGRTHHCRLDAVRLAEAHAWIQRYERFWAERLGALEALLDEEDEAAGRTRASEEDTP